MLPNQSGQPCLTEVMVSVSFFTFDHLIANVNYDKVSLIHNIREECAVRPTTLHDSGGCLTRALYYL